MTTGKLPPESLLVTVQKLRTENALLRITIADLNTALDEAAALIGEISRQKKALQEEYDLLKSVYDAMRGNEGK